MPNPVITRITRDDLAPPLQAAWDQMTRISGEAVSIEVMANNPAAMGWYNDRFYGEFFNGGHPGFTLDARTKEVLRLRLSKGHGCHVCNTHNEITAKEQGLTDAQIMGIAFPEPGLFDDKDMAVIDLAAEIDLGNQQGYLSAPLYARLRTYYDDAQIVEMGMLAAFLTGMAKFLFTFDLVTRDATCPIARPEAA